MAEHSDNLDRNAYMYHKKGLLRPYFMSYFNNVLD
jgi:hypothetical protein